MDLSTLLPAQRVLAEEVIYKCAVSREYFVREVLGVKFIEKWQLKVLRQLDKGETKISIRSGHGVGKTTLCSWLALHFLLFRDDVKIIVTSPSAKQMTDGLIPEVQKWIKRLPGWMQDQLDSTSERVTRSPNNANNFISYRTARKENPEALAGVHATHVMIIVDEASGVDEVIYETGQGSLSTEGAIAVLIGNPTKPTGFFFKTHNSLKDLWWNMKVSCFDSSRVDESYIAGQRRTYGEDSREWKVRVLGEFPDSGASSVIPRSFVESAVGRDIDIIRDEIYWGVDPGRGGDPSGFVERTPNGVTFATMLRYDDVMRLVGWVKRRWDETAPHARPKHVFVDSIGLGAGVADRLQELGLPVVHVNVSESASLSDRFVRLRAEIWYATRTWFEGMNVWIDPQLGELERLITELVTIEERERSDGKIDVESKREMKTRGVGSPNLADALVMTFAKEGAVANGSFRSGGWGKVDTSLYRAPGLRRN